MKTIYKGQDDLFYVLDIKDEDGTQYLPSDLDTLIIRMYTRNPNEYAEFTKDDIKDDVLYINADALSALPDGALKMKFLIGISDPNFTDGIFDSTAERLTGYFIKTPKINS